ncbi:MAG: SOS response-associated peptidase [Candidatus Competibacter sp.]|nr:SOS response-associated peptidase [Candidatus Competibacter sp.]MDG4585353.1 SOS response-associated peptidase [Candidatus Competibacter sp.]
MCGRFIQCTSGERLAERFQLSTAPRLTPRYNVAPSQPVGAIRVIPAGQREFAALRWGLIPAWSPEPRTSYSTINARAETVADKPTYRQAFRRRRCLIPADGFYEWRRVGTRKQPYCIAPADGQALAFAGLWERWERDGQILESCTILVTTTNALIAPIHDRMPVILDPQDEARWLDPTLTDPADLKPLLIPCPPERLRIWPVGTAVNATRHNGPELMAAVTLPS